MTDATMQVHGACHCGAIAYGLRVGCLDEKAALAPRRRIWCRSALEWSVSLHGLETRERE